MTPLLFLSLLSILTSSAQEIIRTNRVRFPGDLIQQHNVGAQMFASESQALPIMITAGSGAANGQHYVLPKAPSPSSPFGQTNNKGYAEGIILPYNPHQTQKQQEFHQTVPPPIVRNNPFVGSQSSYVQRQKAPSYTRPPTTQQPADRHRFGSQRIPYSQQRQKNPPSQHAKHQIYVSGLTNIKDANQNPDVAVYRYSIVTSHGPPKASSPDHFEMEFIQGMPEGPTQQPKQQVRPQDTKYNNQHPKGQTTSQRPNIVKETANFHESDFEQGFGDWQISGKFPDVSSDPENFFNKKQQKTRPQSEKFSNSHSGGNVDDDFPSFDDFPEFVTNKNKNNKRYSYNRGNTEYKRGEVKSVYKPVKDTTYTDNKKKQSPQKFPSGFGSTKSKDSFGDENLSSDNFYPDFDYPQKQTKKPNQNKDFQHSYTFLPKTHKKSQRQQSNSGFNFKFPSRGYKNQKNPSSFEYGQNYDYPQKQNGKKQNDNQYEDYDFPDERVVKKEDHKDNSNFGSEWIPINAPEGYVPAKSYDIPAPDLSKGPFYEKKSFLRREFPQEYDDGSLVYGVQKRGNSEEVVSAVFRVKQ